MDKKSEIQLIKGICILVIIYVVAYAILITLLHH